MYPYNMIRNFKCLSSAQKELADVHHLRLRRWGRARYWPGYRRRSACGECLPSVPCFVIQYEPSEIWQDETCLVGILANTVSKLLLPSIPGLLFRPKVAPRFRSIMSHQRAPEPRPRQEVLEVEEEEEERCSAPGAGIRFWWLFLYIGALFCRVQYGIV